MLRSCCLETLAFTGILGEPLSVAGRLLLYVSMICVTGRIQSEPFLVAEGLNGNGKEGVI